MAVPLAARPHGYLNQTAWRQRFENKQAELATANYKVLWLGDSIVQQFERDGPEDWLKYLPIWNEYYRHRAAVNLGFAGDTTANLLWRIQNWKFQEISPHLAIIHIGTNNFGAPRWSACDTAFAIEQIVLTLKSRFLLTRVLVIGVLPSIRNLWVDQSTSELNSMLSARFKGGENAYFVDVSTAFMKGDHVNPDLYVDLKRNPPRPPLHPTAEGQLRMVKAIEPVVAALLGEHASASAGWISRLFSRWR